jgi:hypothetical protein
MPVFDFACNSEDGCGHVEENIALTHGENDEVDELGGLLCPACAAMMSKLPPMVRIEYGRVKNRFGKLIPGDKQEQRQEMKRRYDQRNKRLERLSKNPAMKKRLEWFFEKYGVRKTPPTMDR